ncbi:hypothetical protein B9Z55_018404 [Caenorhabditis nigoni]|uniref:Receptor L-domain domain-containing protein n=1 Tax=Caenorhabditis nigoni TaxID=1611254 RepID=A0A2G5TEK8_9PELO|nr:hypothetical protein B9Z55_018404 [Caenorhabditis nigoni]
MFMYSDKNLKESDFQVVDNKKLDAENLCGSGLLHYFTDLRVKGNLKDCGCQGDEIDDSTLSTYKTCQNSYNGLYLNNVTSKDLSPLENIMQVKGIIDISNTDIENLSFLKNLVTFKYRNQETKERISFNLQNNPKMTRFGMPVLSVIHNTEVERSDGPEEGIVLFNFENLHPDFCLTVNEILLFLELNVTFRNLNAKICDVSQEILSEPSVCKFETLEKLHSECIFVIGDVVIDSENEHDIINVGNVYYIFGSLTIKNTKLQSLAYFFNLLAIVHLGDGPAIQLISNKELKDAKFDNLRVKQLFQNKVFLLKIKISEHYNQWKPRSFYPGQSSGHFQI